MTEPTAPLATRDGDLITDDRVRELAAEIVLGLARTVERLTIREHLDDRFGRGTLDDLTRVALTNRIGELLATATLTVDFPEETP